MFEWTIQTSLKTQHILAVIVYANRGIISNTNMMKNVESGTLSSYRGVIVMNSKNTTLIIDQCYISGNTYLSQIPVNVGCIVFVRCSISGTNTVCSGSVSISASVDFENIMMTLYETNDVSAEVPFRDYIIFSIEKNNNSNSIIYMLLLFSIC